MSPESWVTRTPLAIFLFLLLYDGALRKWLVPGSEQVVFILKDLILTGVVPYAVTRGARGDFRIPLPVAACLAGYGAWVLGEVANPALPNIGVGLWGLKAHLLYAVVVLLLPMAFGDLAATFRALTRLFPLIVLPVCAIAFVQIASPADSAVNLSIQGGTDATAYFGDEGLVRVTGTFSYLSGMAGFVQVSVPLGLGLFLGGARSRWFLVALAVAIAALPVTGSRGVIVSAALSAAIMLAAALVSGLTTPATFLGAVATTGVLLAISLVAQAGTWAAMGQRAFGDSSDNVRAVSAFTNAFEYLDTAGFAGFGTGAANLGAAGLVGDVAPFSWLPFGSGFEEESGRIVLELGLLGWLLSMTMRLSVMFWALALLRGAGANPGRLAAVIALPTVIRAVWVGNGVFDVPLVNFYFWFCVALLAMAQFEASRLK